MDAIETTAITIYDHLPYELKLNDENQTGLRNYEMIREKCELGQIKEAWNAVLVAHEKYAGWLEAQHISLQEREQKLALAQQQLLNASIQLAHDQQRQFERVIALIEADRKAANERENRMAEAMAKMAENSAKNSANTQPITVNIRSENSYSHPWVFFEPNLFIFLLSIFLAMTLIVGAIRESTDSRYYQNQPIHQTY